MTNDLHFDAATQQGVMFHLLGALPEHGKLGSVAIGETHAAAERYFRGTLAVLHREAMHTTRAPLGRRPT